MPRFTGSTKRGEPLTAPQHSWHGKKPRAALPDAALHFALRQGLHTGQGRSVGLGHGSALPSLGRMKHQRKPTALVHLHVRRRAAAFL